MTQRRLRVKFILPALTEATSPFWRLIKYSLFPPLGLATLAAYLRDDDEAVIIDEHVERVDTDDCLFVTTSSEAWRQADVAFGTDPDVAAAAAARCAAAYTGEPAGS